MLNKRRCSRSELPARRGVATLWLILALPIFLIILGAILEISNLWLARIQLKNGLDAAALAAVKEWAETPLVANTQPARDVGVSFANANKAGGDPIPLSDNSGSGPNQNDTYNDGLILGAINDSDLTNIEFDAEEIPSCQSIQGRIRVDIFKDSPNSSRTDRLIGIVYEAGDPNVTISAVSVTIPVIGNNVNQQPAFRGDAATASNGQQPIVSITSVDDALNPGNPGLVPLNPPGGNVETRDIRGMNPSPTSAGSGNPANSSRWNPSNLNGDIEFTFANETAPGSDRFRTIFVNFDQGVFEAPTVPGDPNSYEFVRVGAAVGPNFRGGEFGLQGAFINVVFRDSSTTPPTITICTDQFAQVSSSQSEAVCELLGNADAQYGVRAQSRIPISSLFSDLFSIPLGPYYIEARSDAIYDCNLGTPRLVHISEFFPTLP